jgi:hypothetical protein
MIVVLERGSGALTTRGCRAVMEFRVGKRQIVICWGTEATAQPRSQLQEEEAMDGDSSEDHRSKTLSLQIRSHGPIHLNLRRVSMWPLRDQD